MMAFAAQTCGGVALGKVEQRHWLWLSRSSQAGARHAVVWKTERKGMEQNLIRGINVFFSESSTFV
jgi:hypothetical protein